MINYKKKFIIIFLIVLNSCGYNPIYLESSNQKINITIAEIKGDKEFGSKIYKELKPYFNTISEKKYELSIDTSFKKVVITKNKKGDPSNFNMIAEATIKVKDENIEKTLFFSENLKINDNNNSFEQRQYENIIKNDFARSIKEKIINRLQTLK